MISLVILELVSLVIYTLDGTDAQNMNATTVNEHAVFRRLLLPNIERGNKFGCE